MCLPKEIGWCHGSQSGMHIWSWLLIWVKFDVKKIVFALNFSLKLIGPCKVIVSFPLYRAQDPTESECHNFQKKRAESKIIWGSVAGSCPITSGAIRYRRGSLMCDIVWQSHNLHGRHLIWQFLLGIRTFWPTKPILWWLFRGFWWSYGISRMTKSHQTQLVLP